MQSLGVAQDELQPRPPLAPSSMQLAHPASFPISCEQLSSQAGWGGRGGGEITIMKISPLLQFFCSTDDFFCAKTKRKKKVFHLPRFLLITYERVSSSTHFEMP